MPEPSFLHEISQRPASRVGGDLRLAQPVRIYHGQAHPKLVAANGLGCAWFFVPAVHRSQL
jgi:hypothetical protein